MNLQVELHLSYFRKAVIQIEESLRVFYWSKKYSPVNHNKRYPFCLIPCNYLDKHNSVMEEYSNLELVFLLPRHTGNQPGKQIFYVELDELIAYSEKSKNWLLQQISKLQNFQNPQRSQLLESLNSSYYSDNAFPSRKFRRGELKKNCKEIAVDLEFKKDEVLTKEQINLVCEELKRRGFDPNPKSVASTLRDKLHYHKTIY